MTWTERDLTEDEHKALRRRVSRAERERGRALTKSARASGLVCGTLALATVLASNAPNVVVLLFWAGLWLVFTLWIGVPERKLMAQQIAALERGLRANRAREIPIRSERVVEFEEVEDEGACWAFAVGDAACVFVVGQEFYEDDDFPNADFSLTEILGESGLPIDALLQKRGRKLVPERVIPARVKKDLEIPEHLSEMQVPLEGIEQALVPRRRT